MYCPESIVLDSKYVFITLHTRCDYIMPRNIPIKERINLFRYEFIFAPFTKYRCTLNKNGKAWLKISNAIFRTKVKLGLIKT